jgi:EAL domain-containing protein (putative c-di-GMP-specific phosphodiesterase class I)
MFLREIGCDVAQGYFIGRPMPAERLQDWLAAWEARQPRLVAP